MMRRESGLVFSCSTTSAIWSMWPPSGVGHERHCTPYTGPRSPSGRAHSSQIVTPRSCSQRALPSPRRNHSSSRMIDFRCTFLVVTSGKPSLRSKRIWWPNTLFVPVPVRSAFVTPWSRTWRMKSSYWERTGRGDHRRDYRRPVDARGWACQASERGCGKTCRARRPARDLGGQARVPRARLACAARTPGPAAELAYARFARCAQTAAASQIHEARALARVRPRRPALLGALHARRRTARPRLLQRSWWAPAVRVTELVFGRRGRAARRRRARRGADAAQAPRGHARRASACLVRADSPAELSERS